MSRIKQITSLPELDWSPQARWEFGFFSSPEELVYQSDFVWQIGEVAVCGFIYTQMTNPPWMWFALASKVSMRDLIDFRALSMEIPRGAQTAVKESFALGHRFAKFYGFQPTGGAGQHLGEKYLMYVKEA